MRGLKRLHTRFPIKLVCDNGLPGGTTNTTEYDEYMAVRRAAKQFTVAAGQVWTYGTGRVRVFSPANKLLAQEPNAESIVLKIETLHSVTGAVANSVLLTGDSDAASWEKLIVPVFGAQLASTILLGGHHGAPTFFTKSDGSRYTAHMAAINPRMTVISVGDNTYGHPDPTALRLYEAGSAGSDEGTKIARTDLRGSIKLALNDDGSWRMTWTGPSPRPPRTVLSRMIGASLLRGAPGQSLPGRRTGSVLTGVRPSAPPAPRPLLGRGAPIMSARPPAPPVPPASPSRLMSLLTPPSVPPPAALSGLMSPRDVLAPPPVPPKHALTAFAEALMKTQPPPVPTSLSEILTPRPINPTLGELLGALLKATPRKKTPAEEFAEWLLRQRRQM